MRTWLLLLPLMLACAVVLDRAPSLQAKPKPGAPAVEVGKLDVPKTHPRILFTQPEIPEIRDRITREPWAAQWAEVTSRAAAARRMDPANALPSPSLQTRCFALTNALECAGFHAAISGDAEAAAELSGLLEKFDDEPFHKLLPENDFMPRGEFLEGFATCYDWAYNVITPAARANMERILRRHATINYQGFVQKKSWEATTEANNHSMAAMGAVGLAGLALWHEEPEARKWAELADRKCTAYFEGAFDKDGAAIEGSMYGPFGLSRILPFQAAIVKLGVADIFAKGRLAGICEQLIAEVVPGGSMAVPMNDSDGNYRGWPGVHFLYCATTYAHAPSRWAWEELVQRRAGNAGHAAPYAVLWEGADTKAERPGPGARFCAETGRLTVRSGWEAGDFFFYTEAGKRLGGLHCQGDHGAFLVWSHGGWLACDTGYSNVAKEGTANQTCGHNGVLVGGKGQAIVGGGKFCEAVSRDYAVHESAVVVTADLAKAYAKDNYNPLKRATRTFVVMLAPPGVENYRPWVIVLDHFEKGGRADYTFMLHADKDAKFEYGDNSATQTLAGRALDMRFFVQGKGELKFSTTEFPSNNFGAHPRMDANWQGDAWQAMVLLAPRAPGETPLQVTEKGRGAKASYVVARDGVEDELEWRAGNQLKVTRKQAGKKAVSFTVSLK
ncbi:MAG: heparinase II/III family protein [Planctomycetes bacterium]|nr:heparinase II/III family protein [Planctomycetota bacterium]MCW8136672.1 heparinase II/III family protein [Planctomycetota bacterium]